MSPAETSAAADLGPAVMDEFADAVGLGELKARGRGPAGGREPMAPAPVVAQPPAPDLPKDLLQQTLAQVDLILSSVMSISREDEKIIEQLTEGVYPVANYYAKGASSVAAMWTVAVVAVAGYGLLKWKKTQTLENVHDGSGKVTER